MDLDETMDYIKQFYKQEIKPYFDDKCIKSIRINIQDGQLFPDAIITYNKVCMNIKNEGDFYIRISPTEERIHVSKIKEKLSLPIFIEESQFEFLRYASVLKNLNRENNGFDEYLQNLMDLTSYSKEEILKQAGLPC